MRPRHAESVHHGGTRCRHEWRHGTQKCVRHKRIGRFPRTLAAGCSTLLNIKAGPAPRTAYPKYAGSLPSFHLMLQPTLAFWSALTG